MHLKLLVVSKKKKLKAYVQTEQTGCTYSEKLVTAYTMLMTKFASTILWTFLLKPTVSYFYLIFNIKVGTSNIFLRQNPATFFINVSFLSYKVDHTVVI